MDSGATHNYIQRNHRHLLTNVKLLSNGPKAYLPDKSIIQADRQGEIQLHEDLTLTGQKAYSFPNLKNESLISVGQLCDDGCDIVFNKTAVKIIKNNKVILEGSRSEKDKLYDIQLPTKHHNNENTTEVNNEINYIIQKDKSKTDLARYLHATAFSPSLSTFLQAIRKGNFVTWPGIDTLNFTKLLGTPLATAKGHLDGERKNLQSTKLSSEFDYNFPTKISNTTNNIFAIISDTKALVNHPSKAYMDLTGRIPHRSSRGNQYIVIVYDYDSNAIICEPIKSRQAKDIFIAFKKCEQKIAKNTKPSLYILDNECAADLKKSILKNNQAFELVPPHQHRRNTAERAIRTFKNHPIAGIASCDPKFPIAEWDRILPQCELTLNLLRNSRINPNLSSWAYLHGIHDFNKAPMAPPGTKIVVHSKPSKRASWAYHGLEGWYIGPSAEHYRCVKCYIPQTRAEIASDTVKFIPTYVPFPEADINDHIQKTLTDLTYLLYSKSPALPTLTSNSSKSALIKISQLLNRDKSQLLPPQSMTSEGGVPFKENKLPVIPVNNHPTKRINTPVVLPPPQQRLFYDNPTPKSQSRTTTFTPPPQRFRSTGVPRIQPYTFSTPSKHQIIRQLVTQNLQEKINHIFNNDGKKMSLDELLNSSMAHIWETAVSNELGRLSQGVNGIKGNDVIDFIRKSDVPNNKIVTYARMVCDYRPFKNEQYRLRLTVGGDRLHYADDAASPAASLLETKMLLNSTISQSAQGCRFMTLDIKDFFLKTLMTDHEYMRIHNKYFIGKIREQYDIDNIVAKDGFVYCKIKKGMYGLKQAAKLAYDDLKQHLAKYGYSPNPLAPNIWSHETRKTKFCLCVDDFGVQYFSEQDAQHLMKALKNKYDITVDKKGTNFCGLNLNWNYTHGYVDISMKDYVEKTLHKLNYKCTNKNQMAPHKWTVPAYGKNRQFPQPQDSSAPLDNKGIKYVQRAVGSFLYYGRAVDNTILTALNDIALSQANPTVNTIEKIQMLLDYLHSFTNARIRYYASDMQLHIDSDAAYLVVPKAKNRLSGFY